MGQSSELAKAVNFDVKPIHQETVSGGATPEQRTALVLKVENLRGKVSMAMSQVDELKEKLKSFRMAMDRSSAVAGELETIFTKSGCALDARREDGRLIT